jgi:glucose/arabinose dehydrogenase
MARRTRLGATLSICWLLLLLGPALAHGGVLPSGFRDSVVLSGLQDPMAVSFAPDGRVFVAEKPGRVLVYEDLEDDVPEVFADLRTEAYDSGDRGIMGMELDPEFPTRPYVYVLYTYDHLLGEAEPAPKWGEPDDTGDDCPKPESADVNACPVSGRLVRLEAGGPSGNQAVDEVELVEDWCQQFSSHSVGDIQFDSAGNLYASGGEGASAFNTDYGQFGWPQKNQCGDPPTGVGGTQTVPTAEGGALRSQDAFTPNPLGLTADPTGLDGTVIRVDPDTGEGVPGNPLFDSLDANERRIVAYGLRNPFRFAVDVDELYIANVGWQEFEEINRFTVDSAAPFNFGWPCYEGPVRHFMYDGLDLDLCENLYQQEETVSWPFYTYSYDGRVYADDPCSSESGSAISGITVYRDDAFPAAYQGALFFADSVRGCIYAMLPDEHGEPDPSQVTVFLADGGIYPGIDIEVGLDGSLYYVRIVDGAVHRISYDPGAPVAELTASPRFGEADPLEVELDASGSSDPDGETLDFEWDLDGDGDFETAGGAERTEEFAGPGPRRVAVRVEDESGKSSVAQVFVHPGNTPPDPEIAAPLAGLEWGVGEEIEFAGSAEDDQDGDVPTPDLHWKVRVLHCPTLANCHAHPLQVFSAVDEGSFLAPEHDYPAKLEVELSATDSQGLSATESVVIEPSTVNLQIASSPAGLTLAAGVKSQVAPFALTAIEGSYVGLAAPLTQELGGVTYTWSSWSDGGARVHSVDADQSAEYTAFYTREGEDSPPGDPGQGGQSPGGSAPSSPPPGPSPIPKTNLLRHPPKRASSATARFAFSASVARSTFRCRLDRRPWAGCRSPRTYKNLTPGGHVFRVAAVAPSGADDPTPAVFRWRVVGSAN